MRYFEELLESYNRLKKRSFKIEYIAEAEEPTDEQLTNADQAAEELLGSKAGDLAQEEPGEGTDPDGNPKMKKVYSQQNPLIVPAPNGTELRLYMSAARGAGGARSANAPQVIKVDVGGQSYGAVADESGAILPEFKAKKNYKKFVGLFGAGEEPELSGKESAKARENRQNAAAEQQKVAAREEPGGFMAEMGLEPNPQVQKSQAKMVENIGNFQPEADDADGQFIKSRAQGYVYGSTRAGFEYKLGTATTIMTKDGVKKGEGPLDPTIAAEAAEAHEMLSDALGGQPDCEGLSQRVGTYGDKIILFSRNGKGSSDSQGNGLAFKRDKFQDVCLREAKKKCPQLDTELKADQFSTQEKNAVKGTLHESMVEISQLVLEAIRSGDPTVLQEKVGELKELVQSKRELLGSIAADQDSGTTPEGAWEAGFIDEHLAEITTDEGMINFLRKELTAILPVVEAFDADSVRQAGTSSRTGDRRDIEFVYSDRARAEEKAKAAGGSVRKESRVDPGPPRTIVNEYVVGVGLKRLTKLSKFKLGDINSAGRLMDGITGSIDATDRDWDPGFNGAMDEKLPMTAGDKDYAEKRRQKYDKTVDLLTKPKTYDIDGDSTTMTPEERCKRLANNINMSYEELKGTELGQAILKGKEFVDFSDPVEQSRMAEIMARSQMCGDLKRDLASNDPQTRELARRHAARAAMVTGMNRDDMPQNITTDDGETIQLNHNEVYDRIMDGNNVREDIDIVQDGYTTKFFDKKTGELLLRTGYERTMNNGKAETRTTSNIPGETVKKLGKSVSSSSAPVEDNILLQFLAGQQRLLETILNQTKTIDPL